MRFRGGTIEQKNGVGYIYLLDVNDDGRPDLVTSMGHDFGVLWMENLSGGNWSKHIIDDTWSQPHAMTLIDPL